MKLYKRRDDDSISRGYVYATYGHPKYLKHAVCSLISLRRYDQNRPVALICSKNHSDLLREYNLRSLFNEIILLDNSHASIIGFKHNIYEYMPFDCNLYLDSDIIWCKDPAPLWESLSIYPFTITGTLNSDNFFGGPKHIGVIKDILLQRRQRTLDRFGLTYLSRVQTGIMYAEDAGLTKEVCTLAASYLAEIDKTHFQSRLKEKGRDEESCEWSMAMAMSKLNLPVYPWFQGQHSPQLDFIESYTSYDPDFKNIECKYYSDTFVYNLRGLKTHWLRKFLIQAVSLFPGKGDYMKVTPYCLHFGWYHQKKPFLDFSEKIWNHLVNRESIS